MYHIFKLMNIRNRAYVIDNRGNKLFYGTEYQCKKFIEYMKEGERENDSSAVNAVGVEGAAHIEPVVSVH